MIQKFLIPKFAYFMENTFKIIYFNKSLFRIKLSGCIFETNKFIPNWSNYDTC